MYERIKVLLNFFSDELRVFDIGIYVGNDTKYFIFLGEEEDNIIDNNLNQPIKNSKLWYVKWNYSVNNNKLIYFCEP